MAFPGDERVGTQSQLTQAARKKKRRAAIRPRGVRLIKSSDLQNPTVGAVGHHVRRHI